MRFYCIYAAARYVVRPAYRKTTGVHSEVVPGQTITFQDHVFESETVKDTKLRGELEDFLQGHRDFGVAIQLVKADEPALVDINAVTSCIFGEVTPQGFKLCGDPVEDGPYCAPHAAQVREMAETSGAPEILSGDQPQKEPAQCEALTANGSRCRHKATKGPLCAQHDKALAEAVA